MKRVIVFVLALLGASSVQAESFFPLAKGLADGHELPRPYGIGVDYFHMDQDYEIQSLQFFLPGAPPIPPEGIGVKNKVTEQD